MVNDGDEISQYRHGRYISTNESIWKILSFNIHERFPNVVHLAVHLENGQRIYYTPQTVENRLDILQKTTLTAFFILCQNDEFAKTLFYYQVPKYYTWNKSERCFKRRKIGSPVENFPGVKSSDTLSRVYTVHPKNIECFYVRLLLHHIKGPTSFESLREVNGQLYSSYFEACQTLGILENYNHWSLTLSEASNSSSPAQLRNLFAIMLNVCAINNPNELWVKYKNNFSEDIL